MGNKKDKLKNLGYKKILCCDFDGVLNEYKTPFDMKMIHDQPVPGAMDFLNKAIIKFNVNIYSSRSSDEEGIEVMKTWLLFHLRRELGEIEGDYVYNHLKFPTHKPPCFVQLDDRCVTFDGTFPSIDSLLSFKPWNHKLKNTTSK